MAHGRREVRALAPSGDIPWHASRCPHPLIAGSFDGSPANDQDDDNVALSSRLCLCIDVTQNLYIERPLHVRQVMHRRSRVNGARYRQPDGAATTAISTRAPGVSAHYIDLSFHDVLSPSVDGGSSTATSRILNARHIRFASPHPWSTEANQGALSRLSRRTMPATSAANCVRRDGAARFKHPAEGTRSTSWTRPSTART